MNTTVRHILAGILVVSGTMVGQTTVEFDRLSIDQGLSMNTVNDIVQDTDGFLWFATSNGLNRFDGHSVTIWNHDPEDTTSLPFPRVEALCVDDAARMWVGTLGGGLGLFDPASGTFRRFRMQEHAPLLSSNNIRTLATFPEDPSRLWVGTNDRGLCLFDLDSMIFRPVYGQPAGVRIVFGIERTTAGTMLVATSEGLFEFKPGSHEWRAQTLGSGREGPVQSLRRTQAGTVWLGTHQGLIQWNEEARSMGTGMRWPNRFLSGDIVRAIAEDTSGSLLWIGTENGLVRLDLSTGMTTRYQHDPLNVRGLSHNVTWKLLRDNAGDIWGGTFGGGAYRVNRNKEVFNHFHVDPSSPVGIAANDIYSVYEDRRGTTWVGTDAGLDAIDRRARKRVRHSLGMFGRHPRIPRSLYQDARGDLWIGAVGSGLYRTRPDRGILQHFPPAGEAAITLAHGTVNVIRETVDERLWVGTSRGGLHMIDRARRSVISLPHLDGDPTTIAGNHIIDMTVEEGSTLWVGTSSGLSRLETSTMEVHTYRHDPADSASLSNDVVECVTVASTGYVWVGTLYGLNSIHPDRKRLFRYSTNDGLPSKKTYSIVEDTAGDLWVSTAGGICRVRVSSVEPSGRPVIQTRTYTKSDGLQSDEFTQGLGVKSRTGEMIFAGVNGVTVFDPTMVRTALDTPVVRLTAFKKFDKVAPLPQRLSQLTSLTLEPEENFFGFEFVALDFHAPEKNRYRYRLEGFDQDWVESGRRRYATYTNLDPGSYRFLVMASNHDGVWNSRASSIDITVLPPWWQTWWFRFFAVTAIVGLFAIVYRIRVQRLLDIERVRVRIASDLHDDIGAMLTRIALRSETIQKTRNSKDIRSAARHIGELSRDVIRVMSDVVWSIDARNDTVGDLLTRLQDAAYSLFTPKEIECVFRTSGVHPDEPLPAEIRQNAFLICKEALHNVAKHSDTGRVEVDFDATDGLTIRIRDFGSTPVPEMRLGTGLRNMKMRAEQIRARFAVEFDGGVVVSLRCQARGGALRGRPNSAR